MAYDPIGQRLAICEALPSSRPPPAKPWRREKTAHAGAGGLLSQDDARCPVVPTLRAMLGVQGHRPVGGTWEHKNQGYGFAARTLVTGQRPTRRLEQPARSPGKTGQSTQPRRQVAGAVHRRDRARAYPASAYPAGGITIDKAPWQRGALRAQGGAAHPPRRVQRWPSDRPPLHGMARFWRVRRRRATHHWLCASMAVLRAT